MQLLGHQDHLVGDPEARACSSDINNVINSVTFKNRGQNYVTTAPGYAGVEELGLLSSFNRVLHLTTPRGSHAGGRNAARAGLWAPIRWRPASSQEAAPRPQCREGTRKPGFEGSREEEIMQGRSLRDAHRCPRVCACTEQAPGGWGQQSFRVQKRNWAAAGHTAPRVPQTQTEVFDLLPAREERPR